MRYVLFVCTHNAGRSQMAQAFFDKYAPADIRAESAGQDPAEAVWPEVVEAMREVGIDLSMERPKKIDLEMQLHADWAITLHCEDTCPYVPGVVEDWDVEDPAGETARPGPSRFATTSSAVFRDLIEQRADDIRADQTAHRRRLRAPAAAARCRVLGDQERGRDSLLRRRGTGPFRRCGRALARRAARTPSDARLPQCRALLRARVISWSGDRRRRAAAGADPLRHDEPARQRGVVRRVRRDAAARARHRVGALREGSRPAEPDRAARGLERRPAAHALRPRRRRHDRRPAVDAAAVRRPSSSTATSGAAARST